jgi:hypothetical protein
VITTGFRAQSIYLFVILLLVVLNSGGQAGPAATEPLGPPARPFGTAHRLNLPWSHWAADWTYLGRPSVHINLEKISVSATLPDFDPDIILPLRGQGDPTPTAMYTPTAMEVHPKSCTCFVTVPLTVT